MNVSLFRLVPLLLLAVACTQGTKSKTNADPTATSNPFAYRELTTEDIKRAAGTFGFATDAPSDTFTNGRCTSCHSTFGTSDGLDALKVETFRVSDCMNLYNTTAEASRDVLACLSKLRGGTIDQQTGQPIVSTTVYTIDQIKNALQNISPKDLGVFAAAAGHKDFERIFLTAEMEDAYPSWKEAVLMPYGDVVLPDQDSANLVLWFRYNLPDSVQYVKHDGPDVCQSPANTFIGSKVKDHVTRMSVDGEGWEFINLARGVQMFACIGTEKTNCFQQKNGADDIFPIQNNWMKSGVAGTIRKLHSYTAKTEFWIRSSADGRFVANGGESAIVDLQAKLSGKPARTISVEADYDPSFTPDNQAFLFQGEKHGTRVCSQSILDSKDLTTVDFMNTGCSTTDLEVGLYQGLGSNLDNGDIVTINGSFFQSDYGTDVFKDVPPLFPKSSSITVSTIRRADATAFEKVSSFDIETPYQASWMTSPSQLLNVAVVSASTNQKARHGGYRLVLTNAIKQGSPLPAFDDASNAMLCTSSGEKPSFSFDERLMAYYAYEQHAELVTEKDSSADIYIIDLLGTGSPVQITKMPKGFYAQFPHFRSDGWLYFSVYDSTTKSRHIMATDAAILMTR